jgi:hypothetical protein
MTLLAPRGLALLALLVPLVLLYVLKIRRERRKVASTWLWATAQRDLMARSPFRRLIAQVPLIVQALAIAAMAIALARPATRGRALAGDHVAIVIDASASMSALADPTASGKLTRFDLAKRAAHEVLAALGPGGDALVLEAGRDARLLSPLERDRVRLAAAVDRASVRDVEGDLGQAVALAVDRLRALGGSRRIVVITDGNLARPAALEGASLPVELHQVGAPVDNVAIVRVDVRSGRSPSTNTEQVQAFVMLANFGKGPREVYVTMREDNASDVLASRRVVVPPGEKLPMPLEWTPSRGDRNKGLVFEIAPHDAMAVDDVAYGKVPAGDALPAFLAGTSPWVERALLADPRVDLRTGSIAELVASTTVDLDAFVAVAGACPEDVPGGDLLIVNPPPGKCFGTVVGAATAHPDITSWDRTDARMRFLSLDGVHVARANLLEPEGTSQRLVTARQGALVTDASTGGGARTVTVVGFDPGESDWPLKASFVLFARNLLEQARAHRAQGMTGPGRTGEPLRVSVPKGAPMVRVTGPGGEDLDVAVRGGLAVVADTTRAGLYRVSWQAPRPGSTLVPVNLTSAAESDLTPRPLAVRDPSVEVVAAGTEPDAHQDHAWLLALFALGLVAFDVWYFTRAPRTSRARVGPGSPA